jgi:hypothetical protein
MNFSSEAFSAYFILKLDIDQPLTAIRSLKDLGLFAEVEDTGMLQLDLIALELLPSLVNAKDAKRANLVGMKALGEAFPSGEYPTWNECEKCLPAARAFLESNTQDSEAVVELSSKVVQYFTTKTLYKKASIYAQRLCQTAAGILDATDARRMDAECQSAMLKLYLGQFQEADADPTSSGPGGNSSRGHEFGNIEV